MRSSSFVPIGASYIEANEAIGKKDFVMKIKICRREAKESCYWLRLIDVMPSSNRNAGNSQPRQGSL